MRVEFGPFTLDDERHQLLRGGREVHLSLKAYELLKVLVGDRPRAISKSDLHARLWPDTFVSEATLASLIAELRRALDEPGGASSCIRTVHGFGYAFGCEARDAPSSRESGPLPMRLQWLEAGGRQFRLLDGENIIGRDLTAAVCLDATTISKRHARLLVSGKAAMVEDLGSKNGTFVNGTRISTAVRLGDGDEIRLGSERLTYRSLAEPGSTATAEP